jgi:hypothetical protein
MAGPQIVNGYVFIPSTGRWQKGIMGQSMPVGFDPNSGSTAANAATAAATTTATTDQINNAATDLNTAINYGTSNTTTSSGTTTTAGATPIVANYEETKKRGLGLKPEVAVSDASISNSQMKIQT